MANIPDWFVIVMGVGTVFIGLISVIILCKILGAVCSLIEQKNTVNTTAPVANIPAAAAPATTAATFANRQEVIAAISAAIAQESGISTNAIRIVSIKKI